MKCGQKNTQSAIASNSNTFKIIASTENKDLEDLIIKFGKENNKDISVEYAGTLDIMEKLNSGKYYDAVWASNSIWLYMLNDNISMNIINNFVCA